jgi:peptide/nickel transport system ATP-binding protein
MPTAPRVPATAARATTGGRGGDLKVSGLTVRYGVGGRAVKAVDGVDLALPPGQVLGLVGESGSGKSTLARAIVGLAPVAGGSIMLDGHDLVKGGGGAGSGPRRRVQMIFQDPYSSLNPRLTVGDAIGEALRGRRMRRDQRAAEVHRALDLVSLDAKYVDAFPRQLSGGQRQRVAIARALAADPVVLLADEITSALDVSVQGVVLNLIRDIQASLGLSMLLISHNLAVVRYLSDVIAVMYLGRIVELAPTDELTSRPRHPYTQSLLAAVPRLGQPLNGNGTQEVTTDPPDPHHPPAGCRFHPHCPVGPLVRPERTICQTEDPQAIAAQQPHRAACHFADKAP